MTSAQVEVEMIKEIEKLLDEVVPKFLTRFKILSNYDIARKIAKISQKYVEKKIEENKPYLSVVRR